MMNKILYLFMLLFLFNINASDVVGHKIIIDVSPTQKDGTSWDPEGGAPDIYMMINGDKKLLQQSCIERYHCEKNVLLPLGVRFYIEVYDKDIFQDDLIGKGECSIGEECHIGEAAIVIFP